MSPKQLLSPIYTLYLFTKSDTPLVVVPMLTVAMVLAGPTDWRSFFAAFMWLESHLLTFDVKNQLMGVEEDKISKPYRPFASGRIPVECGQYLYLACIASCFGLSAYHGLLLVTALYVFAIWLYNEVGLAGDPILKSPIGAVGYMCYTWGTTFIVGNHHPMSNMSVMAIIMSGVIFSLTGHAQDFRDRSGDAAMGRKTIPIILSQDAARWSLLVTVMITTYGVIMLWNPPTLVNFIFVALATTCAVKFLDNRSEEDDRKSFVWYELWLTCAHLLPIFGRLSGSETFIHSNLDLGSKFPPFKFVV